MRKVKYVLWAGLYNLMLFLVTWVFLSAAGPERRFRLGWVDFSVRGLIIGVAVFCGGYMLVQLIEDWKNVR